MNILKKTLPAAFATLINVCSPQILLANGTVFTLNSLTKVADTNYIGRWQERSPDNKALATSELEVEAQFWTLLGDPVFRLRARHETPHTARFELPDRTCAKWAEGNLTANELSIDDGIVTLSLLGYVSGSNLFSQEELKHLFRQATYLPSTVFSLELYHRESNRRVYFKTMVDSVTNMSGELGPWVPGSTNWDRFVYRRHPLVHKQSGGQYLGYDEAKTFFEGGFYISKVEIVEARISLGEIPGAVASRCRELMQEDQESKASERAEPRTMDDPEKSTEDIDQAFANGVAKTDSQPEQQVSSLVALVDEAFAKTEEAQGNRRAEQVSPPPPARLATTESLPSSPRKIEPEACRHLVKVQQEVQSILDYEVAQFDLGDVPSDPNGRRALIGIVDEARDRIWEAYREAEDCDESRRSTAGWTFSWSECLFNFSTYVERMDQLTIQSEQGAANPPSWVRKDAQKALEGLEKVILKNARCQKFGALIELSEFVRDEVQGRLGID